MSNGEKIKDEKVGSQNTPEGEPAGEPNGIPPVVEKITPGISFPPFLPFVIVIFLVAVYAGSVKFFVKCKGVDCHPIHSEFMSQVEGKNQKFNDISPSLDNMLTAFNTKQTRIDEVEAEKEKTENDIYELKAKINAASGETANTNTAAAGTNTNTNPANTAGNTANTAGGAKSEVDDWKAEKSKLERIQANQNAEYENLVAAQKKIDDKRMGVRKNVAARYAKRMTWIFLTGAFLLLCAAAVVISFIAIRKSIVAENQTKWLIWTTLIAAGFALSVFLSASDKKGEEGYMSIVVPMFNQSIFAAKDISFLQIHLVNVLGFAATIFLLFASCAILTNIRQKKNSPTAEPPAEFASDEQHIRWVLYIGAAMLFVGMLRMKLLADWHLLFVSMDETNAFYLLLKEFFGSSISIQAGFYTIVLAAIYLPVTYAIPNVATAGEGQNTDSLTGGLVQKLGIPLGDNFIPRLISILSPFLAGPALDLFSSLLGK